MSNRHLSLFLSVLIALAFASGLPLQSAHAVDLVESITCVTTTSDGWILGYTRNATTGYSTDSTGNTFWIGMELGDWYYRSFLFFDTSAIPSNATITNANIHMHVDTDVTLNDFNITIQQAMPTYPHDPIVTGDYYTEHYGTEIGGSNNTYFISGGAIYITLNSIGRSWINKDGTSKFLLRAYNDTMNIYTIITQYIMFYSREAGVLYPPVLAVTYSVQGYQVVIHAPYYENGNVANVVLMVNITRPYNTTYSFTLDGSLGAQTYLFNDTNKPLAVSWNITTSYNQTRTIYIKDVYEEIWLYVPDPHQYAYLYTFTIIDYVGVTNAYLETSLNIAGTQHIVERKALTITNEVTFWMIFQNRYRLAITCDQGYYSWGDYIAGLTTTEVKALIHGMFDLGYTGYNTTCIAKRMNNTWAQMNYTDSTATTQWLYIDLQYLASDGTYTTRWNTNLTTETATINFYNLNSTENYRLYVKAHRNTEDLIYAFMLLAIPDNATLIWYGLAIFGTFPVGLAQVFGLFIVLLFFTIFSYFDPLAGAFVGWLIAMLLYAIRWLSIDLELSALALAIVIMWGISRYRERQRTTGQEA